MKPSIISALLFVTLGLSFGCSQDRKIEVDLSTDTPRFMLHSVTWGWPFRWPQVTALAIGADEESLWEIEAEDAAGLPARQLAIVYGDVPHGFTQVQPKNGTRPKRLTAGRTYYVGATGPKDVVFRTIFAVPVGPMGTPPDPGFEPDRKRMKESPQLSEPTKPAE